MKRSKQPGWPAFLEGYPWFTGEGNYPLPAYSEYMPPARVGISPYDGQIYPWALKEDDPYGWRVMEAEEEYQLKPGLDSIGEQILKNVHKIGKGKFPVGLTGENLRNFANNLFWPEELQSHTELLEHERYISLLSYSLSKTKDDKGRVLWTLFGASEQGPEKPFWKSFYENPEKELPESKFIDLLQWIFRNAYGISIRDSARLLEQGFRILPTGNHFPFKYWHQETMPSWTKKYIMNDGGNFGDVTYLLTFRPFGKLPSAVKEKYLSGKLHLIPFPGSLLLWGVPGYLKLQETLHNAIHLPLLRLVKRQENLFGVRVPQSGWLNLPTLKGEKVEVLEEFIVNTYIRTHRWNRFQRNEDGLLMSSELDPVLETLFSTKLEDLDLYNKPMARNSQLFSEEIELLLDGPRAGRADIGRAALRLMEGGLFRYRFFFPPMRCGQYELAWHRPVVSCFSAKKDQPDVSADLITGYLTACDAVNPDLSDVIELWPRFDRRDVYISILKDIDPAKDHYLHQGSFNLLTLLDTHEYLVRGPLPETFARSLIRIPRHDTIEELLGRIPGRFRDKKKGKAVSTFLENILEPDDNSRDLPASLTFGKTANREYEVAYWEQIRFLAHGKFRNKDNADVVQDNKTLDKVTHLQRDLHVLGDYLIRRHEESIHAAGMDSKAEVGELPFKWDTDFEYMKFGGWTANQAGTEYERNILIIIPGKNREECVVMADHYDTAYMEDVFNTEPSGTGPRISAAGADDNYSATSTLLLAAPMFLELSREGKLERDIWLLHLTGEEFPSDCMGARNFCQNLVQKTLFMRTGTGRKKDLSGVKVKGVLVMDMIAHNRDNERDIFQISPGKTGESLRLALVAHKANMLWNKLAETWNSSPDRKGCTRGQRISDVSGIPEKALHLKPFGEVRTWEDPSSSLYNTDGMIFADTGIPVILFMENYDISRTGYHDTHDTMENIDLDYGAAVSAIAIETIAGLAGESDL
jgi:hypothetical protein